MNTNFTRVQARLRKVISVSALLICLIMVGLISAQAQTIPLRRAISPEKPMWLIHVDTWNTADPQKMIDLIPKDIRPYVVINISISINHDATTGKWIQTEYAYETIKSWLRTCAENRMWAMIQQSSGGFQHFSDFDLRVYEEFYRDYPNLIGYNYAEQFWGYDDPFSVTWIQRMAHFTNLLKLSNKYGGYLTVSWCGNEYSPSINPMAMMKRNPAFAVAAKQYNKNFILCEKYTQTAYQSDMESLTLGAYLSGFSGQYGIRYDDTGWTDITGAHANFTMATALAPYLEHIMLTGQTIIDGPELIMTQQSREIGTGPASDGYTTRRWEMFPQFYNVTLDVFRKIVDGTVRIPSRKEVIDRTKVAIIHDINSGNNDDIYSTPSTLFQGLYRMDGDGNLKDNKSFFKKTGRYPTIPTVFELADADANSFQLKLKNSSLSSRWPTIAAKVNELNNLFPQEYSGDIYAGRHENGLVVYNPYKTGQVASGRIPFKYNTCDSIELSLSQYTSGVIKETEKQVNIYLNNYDNLLNTGLKTDIIKIYGSTDEPTYSFTDRANHQPSSINKSWAGGVLTLTIQHNGALDMVVNCSGAATARLSSYKTIPVVIPEQPTAYSGPLQYEAENFDYKNIAGNVTNGVGGTIRNYTAQGYLRFGTNAAASIRKKVNALLPGTYNLAIRYAASAGDVNSVDVYVNGLKVATPVFLKTATDSEWGVNNVNITLAAGENNIVLSANKAGTNNINFDNIVVSGSIGTKYNFEKDIATVSATKPAAGLITMQSGTGGVVSYTDAFNKTSNVFKSYSGGIKSGTGVADLDLFASTSNYSVTWKGFAGTAGAKNGILLRASGSNGSCPFAVGMKQGYLFSTTANNDGTVTIQAHIASTSGLSLQRSYKSTFSSGSDSPVWYRARAIGESLSFECSKDSVIWEGADLVNFTDDQYAGGNTQLIWGLGSNNFSWMIDNVTFQSGSLGSSKLALSGLEYKQGDGPSASQALSISGRSLNSNAIINAPFGYEVSLNQTNGYTSSVDINLVADSIPATNVYVRLKAGLTANLYKGYVTMNSGYNSLSIPVSGKVNVVNMKLYNFNNDIASTGAGTPPAENVSVANGNGATAGVALFTDSKGTTSNYLRPYSGGLKNATGALDLNLFGTAGDYSVVWKQALGTAGREYKVGMLLRGNTPEGTSTSGYVQGLKQGYLFIVYNNGAASPARSEFRIYRSTTSTSLNMLANVGVNALAPGVGQPIWYRASVSGTLNPSLKIEYSTDSLTWSTGASTSDPGSTFSSGTTQFVWGLAAANWDSYVDNITQLEIPRPGVLSVSESNLAEMVYNKGNGPSASKSFAVSGNGLTEDVLINAPSDFEVSLEPDAGYAPSVTLTPNNGSIQGKTIYARLKAELSVKKYSGEINFKYAVSGGSLDGTVALSGKVSESVIAVSQPSPLNDLGYISGHSSVERSFSVSANAVSQILEINAPQSFEISLSPGAGYTSSLSLTPVDGKINATKIYVKLISGLAVDSYDGIITLNSQGLEAKLVPLGGKVLQQAELIVSETSLSGFSYNYYAGTPPIRSFTVGGIPLAGDITVSAPSDFEISLNGTSGFSQALVLAQSNGAVDQSTIYVRLKAGLAENAYSGTVNITSPTASDQKVMVSGSVSWSRIYDFSQDIASDVASTGTSPAQNITLGAGNNATAGVASYTDASQVKSNRFRAYSGGQRNGTGVASLQLFPNNAADYAVTWKQNIGSSATDYKAGVLLRGSGPEGTATTGYVQGIMNGYVFIAYNAGSSRTEFRIYKATAATSLNTLVNTTVANLVPGIGQNIWYRASAQGSSTVSLKFEYSTDSLTWNIGSVATDASSTTFKSGGTQLVWGLASPGFNFYMDNITFNELNRFYVDADKDGYGSSTSVMLPSRNAPGGYSVNNTDCNDTDAGVHEPKQYYVDTDLDGFGSSSTTLLCTSVAPSGYSSNNSDCNDADSSINAPIKYYVDADGDGFGSGTEAILCSLSAPAGYATNNSDCDDSKTLYADNDGDGLGAGIAAACGVANNSDCDDTNPVILVASIPDVYAINPATDEKNTIYLGYGPSALSIQATASGGTAPYSYKWSSGETTQSINVTTQGVYSVVITDKNGCQSNATIEIKVVDVGCGTGNDKVLICHNGKQLCVSANAVDAHLAHGDKLGGCNQADISSAKITNPLSADWTEDTQIIVIHPNPATERISISLTEVRNGAKAVLYSTNGTLISSHVLREQISTISIHKLVPGVYYFRITNGNDVTSKAFIKN